MRKFKATLIGVGCYIKGVAALFCLATYAIATVLVYIVCFSLLMLWIGAKYLVYKLFCSWHTNSNYVPNILVIKMLKR